MSEPTWWHRPQDIDHLAAVQEVIRDTQKRLEAIQSGAWPAAFPATNPQHTLAAEHDSGHEEGGRG